MHIPCRAGNWRRARSGLDGVLEAIPRADELLIVLGIPVEEIGSS
jgi:hypothetical protein